MDIEERIRSRIESVLINDAKNHAEMAKMASDDEPLESDPFGEERNLYQRMISSYRSAVKEVNNLLEENVGFLSGFYQFVENVKDKADFEQICAEIVDCVLQDLGAEYCSLLFLEGDSGPGELCLEGVRENSKFIQIHSKPELLGSPDFEKALLEMFCATPESINIGDVYREPQFARVDFPSLIRSLVCVPLTSSRRTIGFLMMSHSRPRYFNDNHLRVLKILASFTAHLKLLTGRRVSDSVGTAAAEAPQADVLSVIVLEFLTRDGYGRWVPPQKETVCRIRRKLVETLGRRGSILFRGERDLLVLLPYVKTEELHGLVCQLRKTFQEWKSGQNGLQAIRMSVGYSTCEGEDDLERILAIASQLMHPDPEEESNLAVSSL